MTYDSRNLLDLIKRLGLVIIQSDRKVTEVKSSQVKDHLVSSFDKCVCVLKNFELNLGIGRTSRSWEEGA